MRFGRLEKEGVSSAPVQLDEETEVLHLSCRV